VRRDHALRLGVVGSIGAVLFGVLAPAGAATGPAVAVTPPSSLLDGQFVTVTWSGFPASGPNGLQAVSISECKAAPSKAMTDCAPSVGAVSDNTGAGVATLQVHTGTVLARDGKTTFTCDHTTACTVGVYVDASKPMNPPKPAFPAVATAIDFAFPASDCPHGNSGISGTGAEAVNRAMLSWEAAVCQPPASLDLQYTRTESSDGKQAYIGRPGVTKPDFAVTSVPFSSTDLAVLKAQKRTFGYAPIAASGLAFVFRGIDRVTGQPLTHLTLTPSELAHIFNGKRNSLPTSGSDAESQDILDLNPGVHFNPSMLAFGRLDSAAGSLEATSFFLQDASAAWKDLPAWVAGRASRGGGPSETVDYDAPTENLPDGLEGPGATNQLVNGPDLLAQTLAGQGQVGNDPATTNIGYLDSSTAAFYGLPTVCIQMDPSWRTTHTPCVNATPDSITAALAAAHRNPDGTVTGDQNPANRSAYPLLDVSYLIAPTNLGPTPPAQTLQKLIEFAVAHGPSSGIVPPGYTDLPADLAQHALATAAAVTNKPPAPPATTPPTTVPSTTTSTTVPTTPTTAALSNPDGSSFGGTVGSFGGDGGGGGSSLGSPAVTPTTMPATLIVGPAKTTPKPKPAHRSLAAVAFAAAGDRISGHASWAVLVALTLFCLFGLLFRPARRAPWIAKRIAWLRARFDRVRARMWPGRRTPSGAPS